MAVSVNAKVADDPELSGALRFYLEALRPKRTGISGDELLEMGAVQGPSIGQILSELRDARLDGLIDTAEEERDLARALVSREEEKAAEQ